MLTHEEMLLVVRALRRAGYTRVWSGGTPSGGYYILARKHAPLQGLGWEEQPILIRRPEDLARHLRGRSA